MLPLPSFNHACGAPKPFGFISSPLKALLNLNTFMRLDHLAHDGSLLGRRIESLMPASVDVIDIFANDLPVIKSELFFAEDLVGIDEAVQYEPVNVRVTVTSENVGVTAYSWVTPLLSIRANESVVF